jgi:hypothetical protein
MVVSNRPIELTVTIAARRPPTEYTTACALTGSSLNAGLVGVVPGALNPGVVSAEVSGQ